MRYSLLIAGMIVLVFALVPAGAVFACSGGTQLSLTDNIVGSTHIVKATVIKVDDASKNAILKAETYLTGGAGP